MRDERFRPRRGGLLIGQVSITIALALGSAVNAFPQSGTPKRTVLPVDYRASCTPRIQAELGRAVSLLHHMTYPGARRLFEQVAAADPRCAMAHWGIAMTLFQPLWPTRPGPADLARGWEEAARASALAPAAGRERLLITAAAAFFEDPGSKDYWLRIRRWAQAMERAHAALPSDDEVTAFYALALLAVAPVDTTSRTHSARAADLLLPVLARNPSHPGAQHYLVHANDAPGRERESPDVIRGYAVNAPRNPHALHMPTHVYTRLGDWDAVIAGNAQAADAALENPAGDKGQFVWDEFPHAIEYLVYAWLQKGMDDSAAAEVKRLHETSRLEPTFKTAFHLASTRARYALERRAWTEAAALVAREPSGLDWNRFAWPEAVTWFARGLGAARSGRLPEAEAAVARLDTLEKNATTAGEDLFARNIRMFKLELGAWISHAKGDARTSVSLLEQAVALEAATPKHPVTPAPTLPAAELLGDLLLEQRRPADALRSYRQALELYPRRFNALVGAARAALAAGDGAAAGYYRELLSMGAGSRRAEVSEARSFVARND